MCLTVKRFAFKKKAKKDIVCYKVLYKWGYTYRSQFQRFEYVTGMMYNTELGKKVKDPFNREWDIYQGFHSYANKEDSKPKRLCAEISAVCMQCIIPKGSYYYEGKFGKCKSYASESIIIDHIVDF